MKDGRTIVPLKFESWDAFFIVFKDKATANSYTKAATTEAPLSQMAGAWKVSIAGKNVIMDKLASWSESTDADIKYFSGTVTYNNNFKAPKPRGGPSPMGALVLLDLGEVKNIAEVIVNGKNVGTVWKKPYKIDITSAVKEGDNTLQINVTNNWVNRLVGDAQPDVKQKTTFTTMPFYRKDSPLVPSGLIGDVKVLQVK